MPVARQEEETVEEFLQYGTEANQPKPGAAKSSGNGCIHLGKAFKQLILVCLVNAYPRIHDNEMELEES